MFNRITLGDLFAATLIICLVICVVGMGLSLEYGFYNSKPAPTVTVEPIPQLTIADAESFCAREVQGMVDRDKALAAADEKSIRLSGNLPPIGYYHAYGFHYDEPTADKIRPPNREWPLMAFWSKRSEASGRWYYSVLFKSR